jgi:hypothetical protein
LPGSFHNAFQIGIAKGYQAQASVFTERGYCGAATNASGVGRVWGVLKQDSPITSTFSRSLVNPGKAEAGDVGDCWKSES